ncbi:HPr-rel-A system PqqD family peptide chaperone [Sphingomonas sp. LB-2]|uniref:HPr-rel-A system PqqD family peptide chaperone n=1 Tax=Sphingomonas caeni TaxID=2984949 RepID=UPI002230DC36|nr:HPr-rel-A system PqqD family peptide chaperone [Sphingomonas caeni]MCW3848242.1 HPr-rel-A system PqqD family peptide chaperone [Sphingomonas caeni]
MLSVAPYISWNNVEGELALFDTRSGAYHALNASGAAIWRALASGKGEAETVDALAAAHDATREAIADAVRTFIADALARGLLVERAA